LANLIWAAVFAWFAGPVVGAPVAPSSALKAVASWLAADPTPLAEGLGQDIMDIQTKNDGQGTALYHVIHLKPSGFVIVAADDQIEPIIAFGAKGAFDPSAKDTLSALVNKDLPARLAQAQAHPNSARFVRAGHLWQQLTGGSNSPPGGGTANVASVSSVWVAPFLQTLWDQDTVNDAGKTSCYNYYTPPYAAGSTSNYPSGCVATAMAQLMYSFQYPTAGVGTNSFYIYINDTLVQTNLRGGNGLGGPYSWSTMPQVPESPNAAQCEAIGALTFDAGVAVDMEYAPGGSGATLWAARSALAGTFLYANAIIGGQDNPDYSLSATLTNMVNPNLDARKPVMFGIWTSSDEGHCVVCDGYGYIGGTLYHHLNMGWSGYDNAWYALPDIDADGLAFTNISSCIYNVDVSGAGEIMSGRIVDGSGNPVADASVTALRSGGSTYATTSDTNGIYAFTELPSSSQYTLTVSHAGYASATGKWSTGTSQNSTATTGNVWGANFVVTPAVAPSILTAPQSQTVVVGGAASFSVSASGTATLDYQWQFNGVNVPGATSSTLSFSAAQAADAGFYQVVISNAIGTMTSSAAALNVTGVPVSFVTGGGGIQASNGAITLALTNLTGQGQVVVEASSDLSQWTPVFTNASAFGGFQFTDNISTNLPSRYYRAVVETSQ
jgi:hypothetical protein